MESHNVSETVAAATVFSPPSTSTHHPPAYPPTLPVPRKKPSAFCGEYFNATSIDEKLGVLGNECFLNGLSFVPNIVFVLVAVPVLISWNKSIFASMHVKTWVRFPHHTMRWLLFLLLILTNLFKVRLLEQLIALPLLYLSKTTVVCHSSKSFLWPGAHSWAVKIHFVQNVLPDLHFTSVLYCCSLKQCQSSDCTAMHTSKTCCPFTAGSTGGRFDLNVCHSHTGD